MKVKLYCDLFPGVNPGYLVAVTNPAQKPDGFRRYCIEVELPDVFFPDETLPPVTAQEVE